MIGEAKHRLDQPGGPLPRARSAAIHRLRLGFTLVELLVVVAIIAILAAILLPSLGNAKSQAQGVSCMNNGNQMIKAWTMYALDNHDVLAPNCDDAEYGNWLGGSMKGDGLFNDPTNFALLNNTYQPAASARLRGGPPSSIGGYLLSYLSCKCPADTSYYGNGLVDVQGTDRATDWGPRVRSYSMNSAVGTGDGIDSPINVPVTGPWLTGNYAHMYNQFNTYGSLAQWPNPGPSETFVDLDEDPYSINDAALATCVALPDEMVDWPASFHDKACGFAFGDGHSIIKRWRDPRTYEIQTGQHDPGVTVMAQNPDLEWIRLHSSGNRDGTPLPLSIPPSP